MTRQWHCPRWQGCTVRLTDPLETHLLLATMPSESSLGLCSERKDTSDNPPAG